MINNKEKNFISIVAYFYNNPQSCLNFFKAVEDSRIFSDHFENYEIIIVNDGSDPKKLDEIKNGLKTNCHFKQINFVNMSKYQGIEAAINAGNDFAIGDFIYEFDTLEINYDIDLIFQVYEKALEGFDIVSAVPNKTEKLSSGLFYAIYNASLHQGKLYPETFRIISRRAWNRIKSLSISIPYRKAIYANCGLRLTHIFYKNLYKQKWAYSSPEKKNRVSLATDSLIIFTNLVEKIALSLSAFFGFFTIIVLAYTLCIYLGANKPVEGWAPLMGVISLSFFGLFCL